MKTILIFIIKLAFTALGFSQCEKPSSMMDYLYLATESYKCSNSNQITVSTNYTYCGRSNYEFCDNNNNNDEYTASSRWNNYTFYGVSSTIRWLKNDVEIKSETITTPTYTHDNTDISIFGLSRHICVSGTTSVTVACSYGDHIKAMLSSNDPYSSSTTIVRHYGTPYINTQPTGGIDCSATGSVRLEIQAQADGYPGLTCNWYKEATKVATSTSRYDRTFSLTVEDGSKPNGKGAGTYYAKVVNECGQESDKSNDATVGFYYPLRIVQGITDIAACSNGTGVTFAVSVNSDSHPPGRSPTYEWYKDEIRQRAESTQTNTYTIASASLTGSAGIYKVLVKSTASCGADVSSTATLKVDAKVTITKSPLADTTVCQRGTVKLTAHAIPNAGSISYQWQKKAGNQWTDITSGVNVNEEGDYSITSSKKLTISHFYLDGFTGARDFQVKCTDGCGAASEVVRNVSIKVYPRPRIVTEPHDLALCINGSGTMTVSATPSYGNISYEWFYLLTPVGSVWTQENSVSQDKTIVNFISRPAAHDGIQYKATVKDGCGDEAAVTTTPTTLTVYHPVTIAKPEDRMICLNGNATFTALVTPRSGEVTFRQWQVLTTDRNATWTDIINTSIYYQGGRGEALLVGTIPASYNGYKYRLKARDNCGSVSESVSESATLTSYSQPVVTDAQDVALCINGSGSMTVTPTRYYGTLTYRWLMDDGTDVPTNDGVISTAGNTLNFANVPASYNGKRYKVRVQDECGSTSFVITTAKTLTVYPPVTISAPANVGICPNSTTDLITRVTAHNGEGKNLQWQVLTTDRNAAWTDIINTPIYFNGVGEETLVLANVPSGYTGYKYRLRAEDQCGEVSRSFSAAATLTVYASPTITSPPVNLSLCKNEGGVLSVTATSAIPSTSVSPSATLTYAWQSSDPGVSNYKPIANGSLYDGVKTSSLTIKSVISTNANNNRKYRVWVSDGCGMYYGKISDEVTLQVYDAVAFSKNLKDVSSCRGANAQFSVTAVAAKGAPSYQWEQKSIAPDKTVSWLPITYSSVYSIGTKGELQLTAVPESYTGTTYRVIVSDACGEESKATSNEGQLLIVPLATITIDTTSVTRCSEDNITLSMTATGASGYTWQYAKTDKIANAVFIDIEGATNESHTIISPTSANNGFYRIKAVNSCQNAKASFAKKLSFKDKITVNIGGPIALCKNAAEYNLATDVSTPGVKGTFSWTSDATAVSSNMFNAGTYPIGDYTITYRVSNGAYPNCFNPSSTRVITVQEASATGIVFDNVKAPNKIISGCVGDTAVFLNPLVTPAGGTWTYAEGTPNGLSAYGEGKNYYTYKTENVNANYNTLRYSVVAANGCTATDILKVSSKNNLTEYTVTGIPELICPQTSITVTMNSKVISEPLTFEIYNKDSLLTGKNPATLKIEAHKTLRIRSVNAFKCKSADKEFTIKTPFETAALTADKTKVTTGETVTLGYSAEGKTTVAWDFGDSSTGDIPIPKHIYHSGGSYAVTAALTSSLGCEKKLSKTIEVIDVSPPVVTGADPSRGSCWLYPNPVNNWLLVKNTEEKKAVIYSADGRFFHRAIEGGAIDMSELSAGLYMIKIGNQTFKISKF